jgi:tetratricopeptide (TPR) repeat protein
LFALHPLHAESVAWISERKDVLSTFFWILTITAYFLYVKNPRLNWYLLTLLLFVCALMSKPMVVTLPFVLLLLDYWPLERLEIKNPYRLIAEKIPFFIFSTVSSIVTFVVQRGAGAIRKIDTIPLISRIENTFISYITYIGKMIWPAHLAVFYPHPERKLQTWPAIGAAVLLVGITVCMVILGKRYKYLFTGWFWYLGTLVPVIGLVQAGDQAMADRYTYIPLIGLFIIIAWGADDLLASWRHKKVILKIFSMVVLAILSICTYFQVSYWRNSITLLEHALKVTKDNYVAHYYLTGPLADAGKPTEAIEHFKQTLRIKPDEPIVHKNMAMALARMGNLTEAVEHLNNALEVDPNFAEAHSSFGYVLNRQGKFDEAAEHFTQALRLKSNNPDTHANFAYTLINLGRYDEAVSHLETAVQLGPDSADNYRYLASALTLAGNIDEAVISYYKTLSLVPDQLGPMNDLARLLATHRESKYYNPEEAIRLAEKTCKLVKSPDAVLLDTLAAAYAAAGRFPQAINTAEAALRLAESSNQQKKAEEIKNRLSLYKESKPYIESEPK